jgi:hypothetical protein
MPLIKSDACELSIDGFSDGTFMSATGGHASVTGIWCVHGQYQVPTYIGTVLARPQDRWLTKSVACSCRTPCGTATESGFIRYTVVTANSIAVTTIGTVENGG